VLTPWERAILSQVVAGRLNEQLASDIGITETTVKVHGSIMARKAKAASLAELRESWRSWGPRPSQAP
jgi:FixJ family two-component response regulator